MFYAHLSGAGTTTITGGATKLHKVVVGSPVAAGSVTIKAGTSTVAVITTAAGEPFSLDFGATPILGALSAVIVGAVDATVIFG